MVNGELRVEFSNATAIVPWSTAVYNTHTQIARVWPVLRYFSRIFLSFFLILFLAWKRIILITSNAMRSILPIDDTKQFG